MRRNRIYLIALLLFLPLTTGCQAPPAANTPRNATETQRDELKKSMTEAFGALEIYAADNSLQYPEDIKTIVPEYLEKLPKDPISDKSLIYQKTEDGFTLSASGDYSSLGAEPGFPQMNQDGFFVNKKEEFPTDEE